MSAFPERGQKHICAGCNVRFFDMNKTPAACPQCGQRVPAPKVYTGRKRRVSRDVA